MLIPRGDFMKKLLALILSLLVFLSFCSCDVNEHINSLIPEPQYDENAESMLEYLKSSISTDNTLDEIIDIFAEMCQMPLEDDILLNEYGVYYFTGKGMFHYDLVRQYPDGAGGYYQIRVSVMFSPDKDNLLLYDALWSDETDGDFFDYIRKSKGYSYAENHKIMSIDIRIDQT